MRNRVGRRDKRVWFVVLGVFVTIFLFSFLVNRFKTMRENADAASLANFDPGYIISDYQMSNYNSMTEAEIQAFLTEKNPCGNTDYNYYLQLSANTNYKWHFEDGHFVCLSEELFGDGEVIGSGDTAAHIIWQAAQDYKINPQVLIVLIQKETALITDTIPNDGDYRKATGFGCPDTAACSSDYYGFKNQVRNAAKLFREVLDGGWTNYPIGNNYIQYNPNASCGGSVVNIQNLATSALYRYTPYQPNDAALAAGYGEAVCGAYGNRNFYLYFEDWFGGILEDKSAKTEIKNYYNSLGGSNSYLGKETSEVNCGLLNDGCYQVFEIGRIYWTSSTGAWDVSGRIGDRWILLGAEKSELGFPIGTETKNLVGGGAFQKFEKGRIYWTSSTGAWEMLDNAIYRKWFELGTEWSSLGYPISEMKKVRDDLYVQDFEHGRITMNGDKVYVISEEILKRYDEINGYDVLGTPIDNENCTLINNGCFQKFEKGRIYWTSSTGAWEMLDNAIYRKWFELGTEWSSLGYPISEMKKVRDDLYVQDFEHGRITMNGDKVYVISEEILKRYDEINGYDVLGTPIDNENCTLINNGCFQKFEKGRIYWTSSTGAWEMLDNAIYRKWFELGTEWSSLGYPISEMKKVRDDLYVQDFEHGRITMNGDKVYVISEEILKRYDEINGYDVLGTPIDNENCTLINNGCFQKFEKGRIYWTSSTGAWEMLDNAIYRKWFELGTEWSSLGYPISEMKKVRDDLYVQDFEHGRITMNGDKVYVISEEILKRYDEINGYDVLGTPIDNENCTLINNGCFQKFEKGRIYWTSSTGAWEMLDNAIYRKWFELGTEWSSLGYPISEMKKVRDDLYVQDFEHGYIIEESNTVWYELYIN